MIPDMNKNENCSIDKIMYYSIFKLNDHIFKMFNNYKVNLLSHGGLSRFLNTLHNPN